MKTLTHIRGSLLVLVPLLGACATDRQVISQADTTHHDLEPAVIKEAQLRDYLQNVGDRIVDAARELHKQHYGPDSHFEEDSDWMFSDEMQFHFVNSETLNAFTTGGKHMYIYTQLLQTCRTEDELAAVMAHEYGHVYARHVQQGMDRQYYTLGGALLGGLGGYAIGGKEHGAEYATVGAGLAFAGGQFLGMGFTRKDEAQADELGFVFYTHAGWDPNHFADFFQQLIDKGYDTSSDITSDHPTLKSRVQAAKERVAKLPPEAASWRKPPVADGPRFAGIQQRAAQVAASMPKDKSMEVAQTLLSSVASCVSPVDQPEQKEARAKIARAMEQEKAKQAQPAGAPHSGASP
jgi:predicted Zn-dependent protease